MLVLPRYNQRTAHLRCTTRYILLSRATNPQAALSRSIENDTYRKGLFNIYALALLLRFGLVVTLLLCCIKETSYMLVLL